MPAAEVLRQAFEAFRSGEDLPPSVAEPFLDALIAEEDELRLAALFREWDLKGIAEDEIYSIAKIMRDRCTKVNSRHETFVDIVGTGGSKAKTFNVSTAAAFVVAGEGVPVAKHGNKAATSNSGSADVLSALGIEPAVDAATAERCLNDIGICFMFAPNFHRLSPTLAKVRRNLGFPTIFNCVGPLCNPANAPHQLIGVWDGSLVSKMANALARLGTTKSWIVHGHRGLDEISIDGPTLVAEIEVGSVQTFQVSPKDFGITQRSLNSFRANAPEDSATVIRRILQRDEKESAAEQIVLMNAAAAIYISGHANSLVEAFNSSMDGIKRGNALTKLNMLLDAHKG